MTPLFSTLFPVDLHDPLAEHTLNRGRTMWLLAVPEWSGGKYFQDISTAYQTTAGGAQHGGVINLPSGSADGWVNDVRPGGGRSVALNGTSNDYIDLVVGAAHAHLTDLMSASTGTIAIWVRVTMASATAGNSFSLPNVVGDGGGNFWGLHVGTTSGTDAIWAYIWDGAEKRVSGSYTRNVWTRAVWVHGGGNLSLYINGVLAGTVAAGNVATTNLQATVGDNIGGNFSGQADDVAFWNRALTPAEVQADYLEGIAGYPTVLNRIAPISIFSFKAPGMAWTERYVTVTGAGAHNGTPGNEWTFAEGLTNEAAGMRLNMLAGTYPSTTSNAAFAANGTTTAPIWWRGYKTTIGDQDANNVAVAGTDVPLLTFSTGQAQVTGVHRIFSNMAFSGACVTVGGQLYCSAVAGPVTLYRVRSTNTAANANGRAASVVGSASDIIGCYFTCTSSAICVALGNYGNAIGCYFTGGSQNINLSGGSALKFDILNCILLNSAGDAINTLQPIHVNNCSIYAPAGHGVSISAAAFTNGSTISDCHFENVNQASKFAISNISGTNTNLVRRVGNTYFNCTGYENGFGDSPAIFDGGLLAGSGFVNAAGGDFRPSALLIAKGFPGLFENVTLDGKLSPGAMQAAVTGGGGGIANLVGGGLVR